MGHVTPQQQLGLQAELGLLGLGREVVEPLVLQTLRRAHPAAAGEGSAVKTQPASAHFLTALGPSLLAIWKLPQMNEHE